MPLWKMVIRRFFGWRCTMWSKPVAKIRKVFTGHYPPELACLDKLLHALGLRLTIEVDRRIDAIS
jgi:hypothetical protein